jgi:hypothetical protein
MAESIHAPRSTAVFDELIALLPEIRDNYVNDPARFTDAVDVVEALRYAWQILGAASEFYVEADPEHPRFASIVTPVRKMQGDNPDAIYHLSRIRGDLDYRVFGHRGQACYTSFTIHGRADDGGMAGPVLADANTNDWSYNDDGTYEVVIAAERPDGHTGNFLELAADAHIVIVRNYFELQPSVQADPLSNVAIAIECTSPVGPPATLTDEVLAERMSEAVTWVRQVTVGQSPVSESRGVPFVSETPNDVATPFSFRDSGMPVPGAVDIHYSMGRWDLADDEALVMTGSIPPAQFTNVMLWNKHMQTLEYRHRQSSLNASQVHLEADGSYRIVIAHRDPGVPNWLDTDNHPTGSIFWRFLLPETDPPKPECVVVKVDSLTG